MDPRAECTNFLPSTVYASIPMFSTTTTITKEIDGESVSYTFPLHHFEPDRFLNGVLQVTAPVDSPTPGLLVIDRDISLPNGYMFSVMCFGGLDAFVYVLDGGNIDPDFPLAILTGGNTELEEGSYATWRKMATFMVTRPGVEETGEYTLIHLDYPIPQAEVLIPEYPTQLFPQFDVPFAGTTWATPTLDTAAGYTLVISSNGAEYNDPFYLPKYQADAVYYPELGEEFRLLNLLDNQITLAFEAQFVLEPTFINPYGYGNTSWRTFSDYKLAHPDASFSILENGLGFALGDPGSDELDCNNIALPLPHAWADQTMPPGTRIMVRLDSITFLYSPDSIYVGICPDLIDEVPGNRAVYPITVGGEWIFQLDTDYDALLFIGTFTPTSVIQQINVKVWLETAPDVWVGYRTFYNYQKPIPHKIINLLGSPYLDHGGYARAVLSKIEYAEGEGTDVTSLSWSLFGDIGG